MNAEVIRQAWRIRLGAERLAALAHHDGSFIHLIRCVYSADRRIR